MNTCGTCAAIQVGDIVEWKPLFAPGISHGRVSRIVDGTVYVAMLCARRYRGEETWYESEVHFEPGELCRLAIVGPVDSQALRTLAANVATGAALCRAFDLGIEYQRDVYSTGAKYAWCPGCRGDAP